MKKYILLYSVLILTSCKTKDNEKSINIVSPSAKDTLKATLLSQPADNIHSLGTEAVPVMHANNSVKQNSSVENASIQFKAPDLSGKEPTIKTYPVGENGWGYDIVVNGKVFITQSNIPAVNRNIPFSSSHDAQQVAELMVFKMQANINPPSVTVNELDSLNIKR